VAGAVTTFIELQQANPVEDLGPELAVFDRIGMLAASYRRVQQVHHAWVYNRDDAGIDRWLILDTEERARALCLHLAERRGPRQQPAPPDLDDMLRDISR
jgi:hypothetical protein